MIGRHSVIIQSLYSKDARVTECRPITRTSLQDTINSLPIVGDKYSTTRTRNAFASLIMSIEAFYPPSYWYNLSSNNDGSFKSEDELVNIEIIKSKVDILVENKLHRRGVSFVRIGNENYPSFLKASTQYKSCHPPPVINTCDISRIFLASIMDEISDSISWNECINNNNMEKVMFRIVNKKMFSIL